MKHGYIVVDAGILHSHHFQNVFLTTWPIIAEQHVSHQHPYCHPKTCIKGHGLSPHYTWMQQQPQYMLKYGTVCNMWCSWTGKKGELHININIISVAVKEISSSETWHCHWVISSQRVKGSCCLHFKGSFLFNDNLVFHHQLAPILSPALFDLRFSHWFCWGFTCSGTRYFVIPNILKIMGPPYWTFEDEGTMLHEMSWTAYVNDTVSHSNWLES